MSGLWAEGISVAGSLGFGEAGPSDSDWVRGREVAVILEGNGHLHLSGCPKLSASVAEFFEILKPFSLLGFVFLY